MGIPIVGAPELIIWYPTVILACKCRDPYYTLILIHWGCVVNCPGCKHEYIAAGVNPDGTVNILKRPPTLKPS